MTQDVFTALADPTRRALLEELSIGERAVGELVAAVEASQPTVSKHLRVLRESGLVHQRAEGQKRFYRIQAEVLLETAGALRELAGGRDVDSAQIAPSNETVAKAASAGPAPTAEPVRIVSAEAVQAQEDRDAAAEPITEPVEAPASESAPPRLDPLSAVQDDPASARGRGVSGLVSSVLRRRRR